MDVFSKSEVPDQCLRDVARTSAFREAIKAIVRPGDIVVDAGAGTGILSFFASQAGAAKVYAIELDKGLIKYLRSNAKQNGMAGTIEIIDGDARGASLPLNVNVVIAELIETWLLDELQIPVINTLHQQGVIGKDTKVIPRSYQCLLELGAMEFTYYGLTVLGPTHDWSDWSTDAGWLTPVFKPFTKACGVATIDFCRPVPPELNAEVVTTVETSGPINACRLSGIAWLTDTLSLGATYAFNGNKVLPIEPLTVSAGAKIQASIRGTFGGGLPSLRVSLNLE